MSFVISLFCALLATLLQQWARRYLGNTQPARCSPEKRARLRSFFAGGVDKTPVSWAVESLSVLVHLSLFLFFSGLIIFLHNVNHNVSLPVISCVGILLLVYGCLTFMPIFLPESPYNTPLTPAGHITYLSLSVSALVGVGYVSFPLALFFYPLYKCLRFLLGYITSCFRNRPGHRLGVRNRGDSDANPNSLLHQCEQNWRRFKKYSLRQYCSFAGSVVFSLYSWTQKSFYLKDAIEDPDIFPLSKIDLGILNWSVGALGEAEELENVIEAIPGFLNSQKVKNLKKDLPDRSKFIKSLGQFLGRTLLSNSLSEQAKTQRVEICMNAANKICDSRDIKNILRHLSCLRFDGVPQTIQTVQLLAGWYTDSRDRDSAVRRRLVASILPHVKTRDEDWIALARDELGVQENVLRDNIARGDSSVLLAIFLHEMRNRATEGLSSVSQFDILDANPELQNEFCASWNKLVLDTKKFFFFRTYNYLKPVTDLESAVTAIEVLWKIRHLYIALHQGTDSAPTQFSASTSSYNAILVIPSSYPSCNIVAHHTHHPISTVPHDDPEDASLHSPLLETQPAHDGTTSSPKADEPFRIPGYLSSPELPRLAHRFPSSSQITNLAQAAPQATSATLTSVHGFFDRAPLDPNQLHSVEASHVSCQSSLPSTDLSANTVLFPHLSPLPVTVTASNVPHPPSVSVQQLGDSLNTLSPISSALTLFHPLARNAPQDIAAPSAASDITGEAVSDSRSLPIMVSAPRSGLIPSVPPSSMESAPVHPDHVSRPLGSTSSTLTVPHSRITPHVSSALDVTTSVSSRVRHGHDEARDPNTPIPMEVISSGRPITTVNP